MVSGCRNSKKKVETKAVEIAFNPAVTTEKYPFDISFTSSFRSSGLKPGGAQEYCRHGMHEKSSWRSRFNLMIGLESIRYSTIDGEGLVPATPFELSQGIFANSLCTNSDAKT